MIFHANSNVKSDGKQCMQFRLSRLSPKEKMGGRARKSKGGREGTEEMVLWSCGPVEKLRAALGKARFWVLGPGKSG
ncbi:hypothetical protein EA24_08540 [Vibrio navarrensis]|nr:hypothetical protein EA24_08540 [Vibrio navarrensis]